MTGRPVTHRPNNQTLSTQLSVCPCHHRLVVWRLRTHGVMKNDEPRMTYPTELVDSVERRGVHRFHSQIGLPESNQSMMLTMS